MNTKKTVSLKDAKFETGYAIGVAESVYEAGGFDFVVTSINDSKHHNGSLHYSGRAFDLRTRHLSNAARDAVMLELKRRLEPLGFDVILESDHIHVEYDPKQGEAFIRKVD